jgi:hypothetical protein
MNTTYRVKIVRDGRYHFSFTVTTPDGQIAVREGGFSKRDAAVSQAEASILDLKAFQAGQMTCELISQN